MFFSKSDFGKLTTDSWSKGHKIPSELEETNLDDLPRMMYADTLIYLPQDILLKVDRASMASSLETRTPFLDHELVEFAFSVPDKWHRNLFTGKQMLKNTFAEKLPANIWKRRKQGFGVPHSVWFKEKLGDKLLQLLEEVESPLNHIYIRQLLQHHRQGNRDYGGKLWLLYSYLVWRKIAN
jgi:asparagine synthase (glutamine-hydrolysing)